MISNYKKLKYLLRNGWKYSGSWAFVDKKIRNQNKHWFDVPKDRYNVTTSAQAYGLLPFDDLVNFCYKLQKSWEGEDSEH